MEYMQRRHSVTRYSPSELVHAHPLSQPPPVGPNHTPISVAAVQHSVLPQDTFLQQHQNRFDMMASWVHDHCLKAQQRIADKQARLLASYKAGRVRKLQFEYLAYVIECGLAKKIQSQAHLWLRVFHVHKYICVLHIASPARRHRGWHSTSMCALP